MKSLFNRLIGSEANLPIEYKIFNIVALFGLFLSVEGAIANYILHISSLEILTCIACSIFFAVLYYYANAKQRFTSSIFLLLSISFFIIIPFLWIFNSGTLGSVPIYTILFSSMAATLTYGRKTVAAIICLVVITCVLIMTEYKYPYLFPSYHNLTDRYIDIMLGMITAISANAVLFSIILNQYNKEHFQLIKHQENLLHLLYHDALTGVYNRQYFEEELRTTSGVCFKGIGVVCCDVDGLKLINDTVGHQVGDKLLIEAAKTLKTAFENHGKVARIGGDEFAVILINVDETYISQTCQEIRSFLENNLFQDDGIRLTLSLGWAYSSSPSANEDLLLQLVKQADDQMYRQKLSSGQSNRSALVQGMLELLKIRDFITEGHSQRLQQHVLALGQLVGLKESQLTDLRLLAQFHDIGKVGVSDNILLKPGPLTPQEKKEMERHSEIGYRIAHALPELNPISDFILKHHEWWNGKGYPLGLKGEDIPIESRILSIADSYDAMTSDRPYRKPLDHALAKSELLKCSGTQFDPKLVELFISLMENKEAPRIKKAQPAQARVEPV